MKKGVGEGKKEKEEKEKKDKERIMGGASKPTKVVYSFDQQTRGTFIKDNKYKQVWN